MERSPSVAFVYPNPRTAELEGIADGRLPDTRLWGENHLAGLGVDAFVHAPGLRRRERRSGLRHRMTWSLRELPLAWELRDADVAVTSLVNAFPLLARARRRPLVIALDLGVLTRLSRASAPAARLARAGLRASAAVACMAQEHGARIAAAAGVASDRVHVVLLGTDADYWRAQPPAPNGYVLSIGRDLARDYPSLLAAANGLGARVVVAAKAENLRGIAVPSSVEVRLDVPQAEVRDLYAGAACVVLPMRAESYAYGSEGSGITALLEAMACARPVLVTERSYLPDYAESGTTALVVPAEDPAALRESLERMLGDRELAERLGAAARRAVEERFTTRHMAERLAVLIKNVLG